MTFIKKQAGLLLVLCLLLTFGTAKAQSQVAGVTAYFINNSIPWEGSTPALEASFWDGSTLYDIPETGSSNCYYSGGQVSLSSVDIQFTNYSGYYSQQQGVGGSINIKVVEVGTNNIVYDETQYIDPYNWNYNIPGAVTFTVPNDGYMVITVN